MSSLVYAFFKKETYIGRKGETHLVLLKRMRLIEEFDLNPKEFIMGRFREYLNSEILFDICSDLQLAKIKTNPFSSSKKLKKEFQVCLLEHFPNKTLYIMDMGFENRVPSVSHKKFKALIKNCDKVFYQLNKPHSDSRW